MNRTTLTGALDSGGNWRLTADLLELSDAQDKPTRIFAVRDIRAVSRESFRLRLVLGGGEFAVVECGSMGDAVNLEDGLNQRIGAPTSSLPPAQGYVAPQTNPRRKIENIVITIVLSVIGVFALLAWIGNQMGPPPMTPISTTTGSQGSSSSQSSVPVSIDLSGTGQQATRTFQLRPGLARFEFRNTGRNNFIARLMDSNGQSAGLIANEIGTSSGSKAIGITRAGSYLIDVSSDGPWSITVTQ